MTSPDQLWTEEEVAAYFRVSARTLARLRKEGLFPGTHAIKVGRRFLYPPGPEIMAREYGKPEEPPGLA